VVLKLTQKSVQGKLHLPRGRTQLLCSQPLISASLNTRLTGPWRCSVNTMRSCAPKRNADKRGIRGNQGQVQYFFSLLELSHLDAEICISVHQHIRFSYPQATLSLPFTCYSSSLSASQSPPPGSSPLSPSASPPSAPS
jgi:hypothetical protein